MNTLAHQQPYRLLQQHRREYYRKCKELYSFPVVKQILLLASATRLNILQLHTLIQEDLIKSKPVEQATWLYLPDPRARPSSSRRRKVQAKSSPVRHCTHRENLVLAYGDG